MRSVGEERRRKRRSIRNWGGFGVASPVGNYDRGWAVCEPTPDPLHHTSRLPLLGPASPLVPGATDNAISVEVESISSVVNQPLERGVADKNSAEGSRRKAAISKEKHHAEIE